MGSQSPTVVRKGGDSLDLVRFRDVLDELASRGEKEPLLEVVLGLLTQCKDVLDQQAYEIALLKKQLFGRRSEKVSPDQLRLFAGVLEAAAAGVAAPAAPADEQVTPPPASPPKARTRPPLRRRWAPTQTVPVPVPDDERACPRCGGNRCAIQPDRCVVMEYFPPKIEVIEYVREKLVCRGCEGELARAPAPAEKVIEGALPGPRLLAELATKKLVDGMPLHRTKRSLGRTGYDLPVSTLNRWEGFGYRLGAPVIERIEGRVLDADIIQLDDTSLKIRDPAANGGTLHGHVWVFVGKHYDPGGDLGKTETNVCYLYAPTWEAKYPAAFLQTSRAVLQGDAYKGYTRIGEPKKGEVKNVLVGCAMHARRPFVRALEARDPGAPFFVERFQALYRLEAQAKEEGLRADQRLELRQTHSRLILDEMLARARELEPLPLTKPMREGVRYLINQYDRLLVPFDRDGRLEIDNGEAERRLRRVASGRKAWLFAGSHGGAQRFASMLSLVSTAEAAGVEPGTYLADVFGKIAGDWPQSRLDDLLPHRWKTLEKAAQ